MLSVDVNYLKITMVLWYLKVLNVK
uniref:Uncharacterized protein n=1 Tax=Anguilla anguilla TaxID=7936 RepID=A0A0E9SLW0_ANGAN